MAGIIVLIINKKELTTDVKMLKSYCTCNTTKYLFLGYEAVDCNPNYFDPIIFGWLH
jgi:hypothetical protein